MRSVKNGGDDGFATLCTQFEVAMTAIGGTAEAGGLPKRLDSQEDSR